MHRNSRLIFSKYAPSYFKPGMRVLEIAPDGFPSSYRQLITTEPLTWETLDVTEFVDGDYARKLTYAVKEPYQYPIPDNTYDLILSGQVIEHVPKPWLWLKEISRVCKVGGHVITVNPTNWVFHEAPVDCWRIYPDGMRSLYEDAGLKTVFSTFECVEPWHVPILRCLRQLVRVVTFRKPNFLMGEVLDTISIGQKIDAPKPNAS